jgi:transmembrane sensor
MSADCCLFFFPWRRKRAELDAAIRASRADAEGESPSGQLEREFHSLLKTAEALQSREFAARADARKAWNSATSRIGPRLAWMGVAATACTLIALYAAIGQWRAQAPEFQSSLSSGSKISSVMVLPDGSRVRLNVGSRMEARYFGLRREVVLEEGEAYFEVVHDAVRPFEVVARDLRVRVVGTGFDVRLGRNVIDVGVREGTVQVIGGDPQSVFATLAAGRALRIVPGRLPIERAVPPDHVGSWKDGILSLHRTPLGELAEEVGRYHPDRRLVVDSEIAALPVSGAFRISDPDGLIAAVSLALPVKAAHLPDGTVRIHALAGDMPASVEPAR